MKPRRPSILAALLAAAMLLGSLPGVTAAGAPWTRAYRAGGPITLDTDLVSASGTSAWAIDAYLRANTALPPLGAAFMAAEREHGVNARFLLAAALHESGWGTSWIARVKHNLFGLNAYDRDPARYASAFATFAANIDATARFMREAYLSPGGRWWSGRPTLRAMQRYWSSSGRWGEGVSRIASSLRLPTLRGRAIRMATPLVKGHVYARGRVAVTLRWTGGRLPAALRFEASWVPIVLDSRLTPDTADDAATASVRPTAARRVRSTAHTVTLSVPAPRRPGRYRLQLTLLDSDGGRLPRADRVRIPKPEVRVWGDRGAAVSVVPLRDGGGVTVRITNTGRVPIPAVPAWAGSVPSDTELSEARSVVTVTATTADATRRAPVVLVTAPLARDLAPGASLTFRVAGIAAATGRTANWLSVDLRVADDPGWLAASLPVGVERRGTRLGALVLPAPPVATEAPAGGTIPGGTAAALAPAPSAALAPAPSASPPPTSPAGPAIPPVPATPRPTVAPAATPRATATPRPTPSPTPKPRPARPTTRWHGEHSGAITYRGAWGDAAGPGYAGGNVAWSTSPGASATLRFRGTSVSWVGPLGPTRGRAAVILDGRRVATISLWRATFVPRATLFRRSWRSARAHTLTIRVLSSPGHPYVAIDGFRVRS